MSLRDRAETAAGLALSRLPDALARRVAGGGAVTIDGQTLHPEMQLLLALAERTGRRPYEELGLVAARAEIEKQARALAGRMAELERVEDHEVEGPAGPLAARLYAPAAGEPLAALVFWHAGGHVIGSNASAEGVCRFLARQAGMAVVSIDYRHAPEDPFPAAADDALAGFAWVRDRAAELGLDPRRLAAGGDSAGGNLAAVVAREADPRPAFQLLIYPVTDMSARRPSYELFETGFLLTRSQMDWYRRAYTGDDEAILRDPRASPLLAGDLAGLPPAFVATAGFDPLRDEGEEYAARLAAAGVPAVARRYEGLIHGFANMTGWGSAAREAMIEIAGALRMGLAPR